MAERLSTGFANAINTVGDVKTIMANGVIAIYSGTQPTTADLIETGTLLAHITLGSVTQTVPMTGTNGLNMGTSSGGVLSKAVAESWSGNGEAAAGVSPGTAAGWFRWYDAGHVVGASSSEVRMDGNIGTSSTNEMQLSNTSIVTSNPISVTTFTFTIPLS